MSVTLKTVTIDGKTWKPYAVDFRNSDGIFSVYVMAISEEHVHIIIQDLRESELRVRELV